MKENYKSNFEFYDSAVLNNLTFEEYLREFEDLCLSMFEWVNLPSSMNAQAIERWLFFYGICAFLKTEKYGYINTKASTAGEFNIYAIPTKLNCYSYGINTTRKVYTGLKKKGNANCECILVANNWDRTPTAERIELFAWRMANAQRVADVNIDAQRTTTLIVCDEKSRLTLENLYNKVEGGQPVIFGDKNQINKDVMQALSTGANFIAKDLIAYKKEIFNEALSFLGINNIAFEKKERLVTEEASANNEVINLNLQKFLEPRKLACKYFNEKYGLTGDDAIDVKVRSDLYNIIKTKESAIVGDTTEIEDIVKE